MGPETSLTNVGDEIDAQNSGFSSGVPYVSTSSARQRRLNDGVPVLVGSGSGGRALE
jgi:hypothetical protein